MWEKITVTDVEGGQAADLFAERLGSPEEFLSPGATIDCHESLKLNLGDSVYSNWYYAVLRLFAITFALTICFSLPAA